MSEKSPEILQALRALYGSLKVSTEIHVPQNAEHASVLGYLIVGVLSVFLPQMCVCLVMHPACVLLCTRSTILVDMKPRWDMACCLLMAVRNAMRCSHHSTAYIA